MIFGLFCRMPLAKRPFFRISRFFFLAPKVLAGWLAGWLALPRRLPGGPKRPREGPEGRRRPQEASQRPREISPRDPPGRPQTLLAGARNPLGTSRGRFLGRFAWEIS
jgi:hypothetical protein